MATRRSLSQIFFVPLLVAVVSAAGLISALIGDGLWDAFSWLTLGIPVLLYAIFFARRKPR